MTNTEKSKKKKKKRIGGKTYRMYGITKIQGVSILVVARSIRTTLNLWNHRRGYCQYHGIEE